MPVPYFVKTILNIPDPLQSCELIWLPSLLNYFVHTHPTQDGGLQGSQGGVRGEDSSCTGAKIPRLRVEPQGRWPGMSTPH